MIVIPFEAEHLQLLKLQESQAMIQPLMTDMEYAVSLQTRGPAFSAMVDGEIIAAAGLLPQWENRAVAWALIGENARRHFVRLTKSMVRYFDFAEFNRLETAVKTDFAEGHRWARMMGFVREGTMRGYAPDGCDYDLYARVKNG